MRRKQLLFSMIFLAAVLSVALNSCKKDSGSPALTLVSLKAGDIDLNGAVAPLTVPVSPTITATFSTAVDSTTATNANITLVRDYDKANIAIHISVSGAVVTITPSGGALGSGALFRLAVSASLKSTGGSLITAFERTFTTIGSFVPTGQVAYWSFENTANDQVGTYNPIANGIIDIAYVDGRNTAAGKAASFNGTTSLIEIANGDQLMLTTDFTLSLWVKEDSSKHDQFILGLAGVHGFQVELHNGGTGDFKMAAQYSYSGGGTFGEDLWFNGGSTGTTKDNGGWKAWTFCQDLTATGGVDAQVQAKWAYLVFTYASATKIGSIYLNGALMKTQDFNLSNAPQPSATGLQYAGNAGNKQLVFGFIQDKTDPTIPDSWADYTITANNHFKGALDDVRVYHRALTAKEIQLVYNSEKP
jgi:hypothetical protein